MNEVKDCREKCPVEPLMRGNHETACSVDWIGDLCRELSCKTDAPLPVTGGRGEETEEEGDDDEPMAIDGACLEGWSDAFKVDFDADECTEEEEEGMERESS